MDTLSVTAEFGLVTTQTSTQPMQFDGICGLSYNSFADEEIEPFFMSLYSSGQLSTKQFAFNLNNENETSILSIGGYDETKDIWWTDIISETYFVHIAYDNEF